VVVVVCVELLDVDAAGVVGAELWCLLWWCRTFGVLVSVSDVGALTGVVPRRSSWGWTVELVAAVDAAVAGTSSAATIALVPIAAPTPVTAVTRRTRRRTWSRWSAAAALLESMSLLSWCSLNLALTVAVGCL
jgi:hypothetical protein